MATLPDGLDPCDLLVARGAEPFRAGAGRRGRCPRVQAAAGDGRRSRRRRRGAAPGRRCGAGHHRPGPRAGRPVRRDEARVDGHPHRPAPRPAGDDGAGPARRTAATAAARPRRIAARSRPPASAGGPSRSRTSASCWRCCWPTRSWCRRRRPRCRRPRSDTWGCGNCWPGCTLCRQRASRRPSTCCGRGWTTRAWPRRHSSFRKSGGPTRTGTPRCDNSWPSSAGRRLQPVKQELQNQLNAGQRPRPGGGTAPAAAESDTASEIEFRG